MKRTMMFLVTLLALAVVVPAAAQARTYFGFEIGIGNAPPPPRVVFRAEPRWVMVPQSRVTIIEEDPGYDMFRYGGWYYVCNGGYWYRAHGYRGPFAVVDVRSVPRPVFDVPAERWHHRWHAMPAPARRAYRDDDRWHGRGHDGN